MNASFVLLCLLLLLLVLWSVGTVVTNDPWLLFRKRLWMKGDIWCGKSAFFWQNGE